MEDLVSDLLDFLQTLGIQKIILLAHSMSAVGAIVCWSLSRALAEFSVSRWFRPFLRSAFRSA